MEVQHQQWCALARKKGGKPGLLPNGLKKKPGRGRTRGAERGTASVSHLSSLKKKQAEGKNTGCQWLRVHLSGCRHGNLIRRPIGWRQGLVRDATDRSSKTDQRWRLERDCRKIASAGVIWEERDDPSSPVSITTQPGLVFWSNLYYCFLTISYLNYLLF